MGAQFGDAIELVRNHDDRDPGAHQLPHPPVRLLLEGEVPDRQDLVDEKHLGIEVRRDGETEPRIHAAGVALDRGVDEVRDAGELHDLVELAGGLRGRHPHDRALQEEVLPPGQVLVETRRHLDEHALPAADMNATVGGPQDARQQLEER